MTTKLQDAFLSDLRTYNQLAISMNQIQLNYAYITSKAAIKREIDSLVDIGRVKRTTVTIANNGRYTSSTIYQLLIPYTPDEIEMMESAAFDEMYHYYSTQDFRI